ncbi:Spo11/DNA topoisomerase VI subunit A [Cladochytrium replicatum]|nr:Spo11/DNA topoisomerase VI subunit A [Cladochytrium replicatum]
MFSFVMPGSFQSLHSELVSDPVCMDGMSDIRSDGHEIENICISSDIARSHQRRVSKGCTMPIYVLTDADPDGIDIALCYKFGSTAMAFDADNLATHGLNWIGVKPSDWSQLLMGNDRVSNPDDPLDTIHDMGLLPLTKRDRNKIVRMLERDSVRCSRELRVELSRMLMMNRKSEIQILSGSFLVGTYLRSKMQQ